MDYLVLTKTGGFILGPVSQILGWIMDLLFRFTSSMGILNIGLCIILFTLVVKVLMFPLTIKQQKSSKLMSVMQPELQAIQNKYKGKTDNESMMKMNVETKAVYEKYGTSMTGGCLQLVIQMPILWALFRFFPASIELRGESFLWANDLSSYDSIIDLPFNIPFYGDHVSLFALLMTISIFAFSYYSYNQTSAGQPQMAGMKVMMVYVMPIMMLFFFNNYSSGLCYYYFLSQLITITQMYLIRRYVDDSKVRANIEAKAARPRKKSKFQQRYEEMLRQQQQNLNREQRRQR